MRVDAIRTGTLGLSDRQTRHRAEAARVEPKTESRALVAVTPAEATPDRDRPMAYREAPFLAQLIATKSQMPQTRSRRRAEPAEALAAYRAVAGLAH